jgi:hypothetical protein
MLTQSKHKSFSYRKKIISKAKMMLKPISQYDVQEVAMWLDLTGVRRMNVAFLQKKHISFDGFRLAQVTTHKELIRELHLTWNEAQLVMVALARYRRGLDQELLTLKSENDMLMKELIELDDPPDEEDEMEYVTEQCNYERTPSLTSSDSGFSSKEGSSFSSSLLSFAARSS